MDSDQKIRNHPIHALTFLTECDRRSYRASHWQTFREGLTFNTQT